MSTNYHKTVMCIVCGRMMRSDTLKRHMIAKHGHVKSVVQRGEGHQLQRQSLFESELCTDNIDHDRSIENSSAEALNQNLGKIFLFSFLRRNIYN